VAGIRPKPGTHENQCPDLMPGLPSGKPWLDALGDPYQCELGRDHGGPVHLGGGARWPNKDYSPTIKINNPQVSRPWPYDGPEGRARLTGSLDTGGSFTGADDDGPGPATGGRLVTCRHCCEPIVRCTEPIQYCKGWKHAAYLHYGPVGAHYCQGRSINPLAAPGGDPRE
jgi:hypothetical protein